MILDVESRWNSTYLMLDDTSLKHKKVFKKLKIRDMKYANELGNGVGVPSFEYWEYVESILPLAFFIKLVCASPVRLMLLVICTC